MGNKLAKPLIWLTTTVAAAALLAAGIGCLADRIIFQPPDSGRKFTPDLLRLETAPDAWIAVRHLKTATPGAFTVLHSHGNAENLERIRDRQQEFVRHGYNSIAYDYEGYGASSGQPSEAAACRDIERVWKYLTEECRIPPERIIIHGFSVGSGPSCHLAARVKPAALVLDAPFTSTFAVVGLAWLPGDRFPNLEHMNRITAPVLIFHGDSDRIIPQRHGRRLYEAAGSPRRFVSVSGAGHNNLTERAGDAYWQEWQNITSADPAGGIRNL